MHKHQSLQPKQRPSNSGAYLSEYLIRQQNTGENYAMLADFRNMTALGQLGEADIDGLQLVQDVYDHSANALATPIRVANEAVTDEWFAALSKLPASRRDARLAEWFKQAVLGYLYNARLHSEVLRNVLTPKEMSDLSAVLRNGGDLETELGRIAYVLAYTYNDDIYRWWLDNYGAHADGITESSMEEDLQDLTYQIDGKHVLFYAAGEEDAVAEYTLAQLSNMDDKRLFDDMYSLALEYVPNAELIEVLDFTLELQANVAQVLGGSVEEEQHLKPSIPRWNAWVDEDEGVVELTEDDPAQDILGALANKENQAAEARVGARQTGDFDAFDASSGDYKQAEPEEYNKPQTIGTSELDVKLTDEVEELINAEDIVEISVQSLRDFDELALIPIGTCNVSIQDMSTYEIHNGNISELPFFLTVDLPENKCIVNIMDANGETLSELTLQLVDYALHTQLTPEGDYIGDAVLEQAAQEPAEAAPTRSGGASSSSSRSAGGAGGAESGAGASEEAVPEAEAEPAEEVSGNEVSFESLSRGRYASHVLREDDVGMDGRPSEMGYAGNGMPAKTAPVGLSNQVAQNSMQRLSTQMGAGNSGLSQYANQALETSDPEVAFDLQVYENDDGSVTVEGNIPVVINALCGIQAEEVKADLLGDIEDEFNADNNPTVDSH